MPLPAGINNSPPALSFIAYIHPVIASEAKQSI
jgi:hypothetical protein